MSEWISILIVVMSSWTGALGGIYLKKGAHRFKLNLKSLITNKYLIGGVILYGLGTVIYILALRWGNLSILYPLISITYIWIAVLSQKMLGEKMNKYKWIGIGLILVGVSLIGLGK